MENTPIGSCEFFDSKPWLDAANILTAADEPLMALKLLEMVPAYYRDKKPKEFKELKNQILKMIATPSWYSKQLDHISEPQEGQMLVNSMLRGLMVKKEVSELNAKGLVPHIYEFAPGTFWLPIGLKEDGLKFQYSYTGLQRDGDFSNGISNGPSIYCAFEIIEHLHFEEEIRIEIEKFGVEPDIIHISTPLYTFDGRQQSLDWKNKDLGHLRTYTPGEFASVVMKMFPGYDISLYPEQVMHLRQVKNGNKFL